MLNNIKRFKTARAIVKQKEMNSSKMTKAMASSFNKLRKFGLGLCAFLLSNMAMAQGQMPKVEMADALRANGKIYVVVLVLSIIFIGITAYLIIIDRKISKLEKELKK